MKTELKKELAQINKEWEMGLLTPHERFTREHEAKRFWNVRVKNMTK